MLARVWLVARMLSAAGIASPQQGGGAGVEALQVTIVAERWAAPFTAAELASAVRVRLPRAEVGVVSAPLPGARSEASVTVRWLDTAGLRVERGSGDAVEFPLGEGARAGTEPVQAARRAALFIALFAEQGASLPRIAPPDALATPSVEPSARGDVSPLVEGTAPAAARPSLPPRASPGVTSARRASGPWSLSVQVGSALALGEDGIAWAEALTIRGRRYLSDRTAVEIGAKLSGEYTATAEPQSIGVADRAFFGGVAYEVWLSPKVAIDLGVAFQYTHVIADVDGGGPVTSLSTPASMGLAVRTSAGLAWSPAEHVTFGLSISPSFSFREREYVAETGREVLELGSMILDLAAGAGVRW